jgi:hypothetical protein
MGGTMDPETKRLLEQIHALTHDNHRLLRSVRRHQMIEMFGWWILWLIFILVSVYGYVAYVDPIVRQFILQNHGNASSSEFQKLIDEFSAHQGG